MSLARLVERHREEAHARQRRLEAAFRARDLRDANRLRDLGEREGMPELTTPRFELASGEDAHPLGIVGVVECSADHYYRATHEDGAVLLLLRRQSDPRE